MCKINLPGTEEVAGPSEVLVSLIQSRGSESAISSLVVVAVAVPTECGNAFGDDQRRDLVPARLGTWEKDDNLLNSSHFFESRKFDNKSR